MCTAAQSKPVAAIRSGHTGLLRPRKKEREKEREREREKERDWGGGQRRERGPLPPRWRGQDAHHTGVSDIKDSSFFLLGLVLVSPRCCARMTVRTHLCIGERVCAPTSLDKDQNGNLVVSCASLPLEMRERNLFMGRLRNLPTGTGGGEVRGLARQLAHGPGLPPCPVPPKKTELFTGKGFVHLDLLRPIQLKGKGQGLCPDPWLRSIQPPSAHLLKYSSSRVTCVRARAYAFFVANLAQYYHSSVKVWIVVTTRGTGISISPSKNSFKSVPHRHPRAARVRPRLPPPPRRHMPASFCRPARHDTTDLRVDLRGSGCAPPLWWWGGGGGEDARLDGG